MAGYYTSVIVPRKFEIPPLEGVAVQKQKQRLVLAFETSCDETCAAVVQYCSGDGVVVLSNVVSSQIEIHKLYGGVVPEIASRNHVMAIQTVYEEALAAAGVTLGQIDEIAATTHPGLRGAVMVGQVFAESLATAAKKPFTEVNHLAGHITSVVLNNSPSSEVVKPPFLSLLVSGGHTALYKVAAWDKVELLCQTSDDAVGEAFDKVAKILGLGYPGGVQIEKLSQEYSPFRKGGAEGGGFIQFVQNPAKKDGFSYSGLKTAVLNYVNREKFPSFTPKGQGSRAERGVLMEGWTREARTGWLAHVCASFQHEAIEQLVTRCETEMKRHNMETLCVCGGVSANKYLRSRLPHAHFPPFEYCTDNAAMIGAAAVLGVKV